MSQQSAVLVNPGRKRNLSDLSGSPKRLELESLKEEIPGDIDLSKVEGNFEISSFLDSLSAKISDQLGDIDLREQGLYNPTLWLGKTNEWKVIPGGGRKFRITLALIWVLDPTSDWSWSIRLNLPKLCQNDEPEIRAIVDAMLSSPVIALELFKEMNPVFKHWNEFWGYYNSIFVRYARSIKPRREDLSRVRRPIRKRGYTDQGSSVDDPSPDRWIKDTLAIKKEEEREKRYYDLLFYILENFSP